MADKAHEQTDEKLERMERHLSAIYKRAYKEIKETAQAYFERFKKADEEKRKLLESGELSETDYKTWRKNKIMYGNRYESMKKQIAEQLLHINETAMSYINGELPEIYALNYNAVGESADGIGGYSFELVNPDVVKNLATEDKTLLPYKYVDGKKDVRWNTKKINAEVLQGILQGESMDKIAKRMQTVTDMNRTSAIRNARTSVTSAENKARLDQMKKMEADGIILKKKWISTNDRRTRHWHSNLNGVTVELEDDFINEYGKLQYPADPNGDPANVYNCRCTMVSEIIGFRKRVVDGN